MKTLKLAGALAALAFTIGAGAANADTYNLNQNNIGGGVTSYGTVDVTTNGLGLNFVVTLIPNVQFHDGGAHTSFSFDLAGAPAVTFSNISGFGSGYTFGGPGDFANNPLGSFEYGLSCNCDNGNDAAVPGPLSFTIKPTDNATQLLLGSNDKGFYGAADLQAAGIGGATGSVGFLGTPTPGTFGTVPEPSTWAMMIMGMGMVGAGLRIRRRTQASVA